MALQYRNGSYRVLFRYHGKQGSFTLGEVSKQEAETKSANVDYLLLRLKQRLVSVPDGMDIVDFLQFDGNPRPPAAIDNEPPKARPAGKATLARLRDDYKAAHKNSLEQTTIGGIDTHFRHLVRHFGPAFPIPELSLADLQGYVNARAENAGTHGRTLSPATIRKEIVSLRTAWNWGRPMKLVAGEFPNRGLRYPKSGEKPPFMTRAEIERQIGCGGLTEAEEADLWDALYLKVTEINDLLRHVKANAAHPFIYPMVCFAAHTGARRSEILRARVADLDIDGKVVTIHERKRVKGQMTTRRVPLSPFLSNVLKEWLKVHPGGPHLFCHGAVVARSNKRSRLTGYLDARYRPTTAAARIAILVKREPLPAGPITRTEANDHLKRTLADSKWQPVRGFHVFRHSFISALANKAVDQRFIDEFVGHQSDEQRRRYRHLYPSVKEKAIAQVFAVR